MEKGIREKITFSKQSVFSRGGGSITVAAREVGRVEGNT